MNARVKHLAEEAAKLTPEERVELIERVHLTLWDHQPEIDAAWEAEIERRVAQIDSGEAILHDADEVIAIAMLRAKCR
jgi:putative addiction module component (TIGR02574 family)